MTTPTIVSGAVSTVSELGKDEAWLQGWLKEQPARLGLGELKVTDGAADEDDRTFVATDDERCFSVDVRLGEMEASHGFQLLDNWARNRVRHPDKTHVAVLVTEKAGDRYRTTLETLAQHLPLVVVELAVWRGDTEAIVVPHVALASDDVDLSATPAAKAAEAIVADATEDEALVKDDQAADESESETDEEQAEASDDVESLGIETEDEAADEPDEVPEDKDDTGVSDPWGLPSHDPEPAETSYSSGRHLLTKIGG